MGDGVSIDAMLGRVLMVAPPDGWIDGPQDWLDDLQPAGVILFRRNLPPDAATARAAIARLHAWAIARGETLLVAMDEEGGFVTQTSPYMPTPPSARALAWAAPPDDARRAFAAHGRRLGDLGVNVDFAPVCDVNVNPANPVIGVRSFGSDTAVVGAYAQAVHEGLAASGILTCAKHFPGHGDTDVDSHLALPVLPHDRARLERVELQPFRTLLPQVPIVMVAHLACPQIGDGNLPATLSERITTRLLRGELGFTGVAVTDAMDMQGVAGQFGEEEAAVRAVAAGCDLLLYCFEIDKPRRARTGLRAALTSGRLTPARLEQAAARVDRLRSLAAAAADRPGAVAALPPASADAAIYRDLCRRAVRVADAEGWAAFASAARGAGGIVATGSPNDVVARLAERLRAAGVVVDVQPTTVPGGESDSPLLVVLGERRPLLADAVERLRGLPATHAPIALANLLTPEVDAAIVSAYPTHLRSADHTDAMLDVVAARILGLDT
jgi:beta-N-acetylhexosaminidase